MAKIITSPVKRFPGTVTIPDFLTIPQAQAWEGSLHAAEKLKDEQRSIGEIEYIVAWERGIRAVVSDWSIDGFSVEPFQTTPRAPVMMLLAWLIGEITALYWDAEAVPNE